MTIFRIIKSAFWNTNNVYRSHTFTGSGTFAVTALATGPNIPNNVDYLIVGGGGGGGGDFYTGGGDSGNKSGSRSGGGGSRSRRRR